jgi:hypothetical protein
MRASSPGWHVNRGRGGKRGSKPHIPRRRAGSTGTVSQEEPVSAYDKIAEPILNVYYYSESQWSLG